MKRSNLKKFEKLFHLLKYLFKKLVQLIGHKSYNKRLYEIFHFSRFSYCFKNYKLGRQIEVANNFKD